MNRVLLVSILVVAVMLAPITLSASKPDWVAPGKYAEYEVVVKTNETELRGVLRWEVKEVYDTYAIVEVTGIDPITARNVSTTVKWEYWLDLYGFLTGNNYLRGGSNWREFKRVPAGTFECYKTGYTYMLLVENIGLMHVSFTAWFETTTGILVAMEGRAGYREVSMQLKSTNIVEGIPWLWILMGAFTVAVVVAIVAVVASKTGRPEPTAPLQTSTPPVPGTPSQLAPLAP